MHYLPAWDGQKFVVCSQGPLGKIAVLDCPSQEVAGREAARMNREAARADRFPRPAAHYGMRRSVRHFINEDGPEDYHG